MFAAALGPLAGDLSAVDWGATPLGPPGAWPDRLTAMVTTMLSSRFSMWMGWGDELTFFCNDAYRRATLGRKYPWALGRPASEVWAEIWDDIGPRVHQVLGTGQATWDESLLLYLDRSGFTEETYHTFSYSPVRHQGGAVAGLLCVVSEETARVVSERRMALLRDLGAEPTALRSEGDALDHAARCLHAYPRIFPFALLYRFDGPPGAGSLAASAGVPAGHPLAPARLGPEDRDARWPAEAAAAGRSTVVDLTGLAPPVPGGAGSAPPSEALVLPLPAPGTDRPYGMLVVGVTPHRPLDNDYRAFAALVARQVAANVTSARATEEERRRAEALAELDQAKTSFFTNVSHELRTPLTLILGPVEEALTDTKEPLGHAQHQRMTVVQRNAERLLALVNTLLELQTLTAGQGVAVPEATDLAAYTADLAAMFRSAFERAGLDVVVDCPPLPAPVLVDREMWAKIVLNLLSNAHKFTFEGGVTVRLRLVADDAVGQGPTAQPPVGQSPDAPPPIGQDPAPQDPRRPHVELSVSDTGVGISDKDQRHLFERFHRVAGTRSRGQEGSGIGLALVAELARLHGGSVAVQSRPGKGSTFRVCLPFAPAEPRAGVAPAAAAVAGHHARVLVGEALRRPLPADQTRTDGELAGAGGAGRGGGAAPGDGARARLLVVDDNADMRRHLVGLLAPAYDVAVAVDGADALARASQRPPDLVLTDVMMPNLDGFGLLDALRRDPALAAVPVVMLSARAGGEAAVEALDAGADDYLVKPFSAGELRARVRANLELERARRHRAEIERSHELLDQAQRLAQVGSFEIDVATGSVSASPQLLRMLQLGSEELRSLDYRAMLESVVHPEDRERVAGILAAAGNGAPFRYEARTVRGDGTVRTLQVIGEVVVDAAGRPARLRGAAQDVTEQRRIEHRVAEGARQLSLLGAQLDAVTAVLAGRPLAAALAALLRAVEDASADGMLASVLLVDADGRHLRQGAGPSLPSSYNEAIDGIEIGPDVGACGAAAHRRQQVVSADISTDRRWDAFRDVALAAGLRACWSTPIFGSGGGVLGTFAMYYPEPRRPSPADLALAPVLTRSVALLIERSRLDEQLFHQLAAERAAALTLQHALLPEVPDAIGPLRIHAHYRAGDPDVEVGGDWYDAVEAPGGAVLMVGDVQGHDLVAATVMGQLRTAARAWVSDGQRPAQVLERLSRYLGELRPDLLATAVVVRVDARTATATVASAGHLPPLLLHRSGGRAGPRCEPLPLALGAPLGIGDRFTERSTALPPGSTLVLYTDGLVETPGTSLDEAIDSLCACLRALPAGARPAEVAAAALQVMPEGRRRDDVAIVVAQVAPGDEGPRR